MSQVLSFALTATWATFQCSAAENVASTPSCKRFRARVAYDGTNYNGWQLQSHHPSVQGEIEKALKKRFRSLVRVVGASRTDTGVHARRQAIHFDIPYLQATKVEANVQKFQFNLNQLLPFDVRLKSLEIAPLVVCHAIPMFKQASKQTMISHTHPRPWHSIFCSTGKIYIYRFSACEVLEPMERLYRYHEWRASRYGFSDTALREATAMFVGTHDFSAFTSASQPPPGIRPPVAVNPMRTVRSARVVDEGDGKYRVEFDIDGAMYKMIRNIMGTIFEIACGRLDSCSIDTFFKSRDRTLLPKSAPAHGLCLEDVFYDDWKV